MNEYTMPTVRQFALNKETVAASMSLPSGVFGAKFEMTDDVIRDQLVARIRAYVLSETLAKDTETATQRVPSTWVDHLKVDAATWARSHQRLGRPVSWAVRRWPATMRTIELSVTWTRRATRPHSTIRVPDSLGPVVYQETSEKRLTWD